MHVLGFQFCMFLSLLISVSACFGDRFCTRDIFALIPLIQLEIELVQAGLFYSSDSTGHMYRSLFYRLMTKPNNLTWI